MTGKSSNQRSKTDWNQRDLTGNPPIDETFVATAVLTSGKKKESTVRLDSDVLAFSRKQGRRPSQAAD